MPVSTRRIRDPDRAARILRASAALFYAKGFHAVTVDEIGAAVDATGAAIYRHFSGKDEILATLFDEALDAYRLARADQETLAAAPGAGGRRRPQKELHADRRWPGLRPGARR